MQMKHTPQSTERASAVSADQLYELAEKICGLSHDMDCLATLLDDQIEDVMFPGHTAAGSMNTENADCFYYVPPQQRRSIGYLINAAVQKAHEINKASSEHAEIAFKYRTSLLQNSAAGVA
jgi:hypothetical protein